MDSRRAYRKSIRLAFVLEFSCGAAAYGYTRNLSFDGASLECNGLTTPGRLLPKAGDPVVFSVTFKSGNLMKSIKLSSRVVHIQNNMVELQLLMSSATRSQKDLLIQLLDA